MSLQSFRSSSSYHQSRDGRFSETNLRFSVVRCRHRDPLLYAGFLHQQELKIKRAKASARVARPGLRGNILFSIIELAYPNWDEKTRAGVIKYFSKRMNKVRIIEKNVEKIPSFPEFCIDVIRKEKMRLFRACSWLIHDAPLKFVA